MRLERTYYCDWSLEKITCGIGVALVVRSVLLFICGGTLLFNEFKVISWIGLFMIVLNTVMFLSIIFIFVGVKTKCQYYIVPWLIVEGIIEGFAVLMIIYITFRGELSLVVLTINIIVFSIMIYCYIVIFSYYNSLRPNVILKQLEYELNEPQPSTDTSTVPMIEAGEINL